MSNLKYIKEYDVSTTPLDKDEVLVLKKLIEAARLMAKVYQLQLDNNGKAKFYPSDATKTEIEKYAQSDKEILSPYTMVERDKDGKLIAIPYHIKFREHLIPIAEKLEEASHLSRNLSFANALKVQADALIRGNYEKAQISWMKIKPFVIQIVIGPIEPVEDEMFFVKRAYEAWVGIMDRDFTNRAINFRNAVFTSRRLNHNEDKLEIADKAQIRVDYVVIAAGHKARHTFTAATLPNDLEILEKYGTETTIFLTSIRDAFAQRHFPLFKAIFETKFRESFQESDLRRAYVYAVGMHEIGRVLLRYRFASTRLRELYPIFAELTYEAAAIKLCGSLLLKDAISQKEMESILVIFITRIFDYYFELKNDPTARAYVLGNAILLNSLISSGALKITANGISWPNFTKMFIAVSNLADQMEKILAEGTYKDATNSLKKYSSLTIFKQFQPAFDKAKIKR